MDFKDWVQFGEHVEIWGGCGDVHWETMLKFYALPAPCPSLDLAVPEPHPTLNIDKVDSGLLSQSFPLISVSHLSKLFDPWRGSLTPSNLQPVGQSTG